VSGSRISGAVGITAVSALSAVVDGRRLLCTDASPQGPKQPTPAARGPETASVRRSATSRLPWR